MTLGQEATRRWVLCADWKQLGKQGKARSVDISRGLCFEWKQLMEQEQSLDREEGSGAKSRS